MSWCDGKNIWFLLRWFSWHNAYTEDTSIHASKGAHTVYASITIVILQFLHSSLFISFVSFCQLKVSLTAPFGVSHWQPMEHSFLVHFHRLCVSCENQNLNRRTNTLSAPDLRGALHVKDQHEECPICLGATRVLTDPKSCASCCQLWSSTLERHVTFVLKVLEKTTVTWLVSLLSEVGDPALSEADGRELLVEVLAGNWADQMLRG